MDDARLAVVTDESQSALVGTKRGKIVTAGLVRVRSPVAKTSSSGGHHLAVFVQLSTSEDVHFLQKPETLEFSTKFQDSDCCSGRIPTPTHPFLLRRLVLVAANRVVSDVERVELGWDVGVHPAFNDKSVCPASDDVDLRDEQAVDVVAESPAHVPCNQ